MKNLICVFLIIISAIYLFSNESLGIGLRYDKYAFLYYPESSPAFKGYIPVICMSLENRSAEMKADMGVFKNGIYLSALLMPYKLYMSDFTLSPGIGYEYLSIYESANNSGFGFFESNVAAQILRKDTGISIHLKYRGIIGFAYTRVLDFAQNYTIYDPFEETDKYYSYILSRSYNRLSIYFDITLWNKNIESEITYAPYSKEYSGLIRIYF